MSRVHHDAIKRNRFLYLISNLAGHGYILVTIPILTEYLAPDYFGFYIILVQVVAIAQVASLTLFSSPLLRFYASYEGSERQKFIGTMFLSFITLQLMVALGLYLWRNNWLRLAFPNITIPIDPYVLYALFWMILVSTRGIVMTLIKTIERPILALVQILLYGALFVALLYLLVVQANWGLGGVLLALGIAEAGTLLLILWCVRKNIVFTWRPQYFKKVLVFSAPLAVSSLLFIIFSSVDRIVLSRYVSLGELGVYGVGFMVGNIAALIVTANMSSYSPRMLTVMQSEGDQATRSISEYFIRDAFAMMGLVVASLVILNDLFLRYLGSGKSVMGASLVVLGVAAGHLARHQFLFIRHRLFSVNRTRLILLLDVSLLGLGFAIAHLLARLWGMHGAGFTFLASYLLLIPFALFLASYYCPITIPFAPIIKSIFFLALLLVCELYLDATSRSFSRLFYWMVKVSELLAAILFYWNYLADAMRSLNWRLKVNKDKPQR